MWVNIIDFSITERFAAMGHLESIWQNKKKYGNKLYSGHYRRIEGEREFILVNKRKNGTYHTVTCESVEMAKNDGWKLLNPRKKQKRVSKQKIVRGKK